MSKRSMGLDRRQVFVVRVPSCRVGEAQETATDTERKRWPMQRRKLFVGATRARDRPSFRVVGE